MNPSLKMFIIIALIVFIPLLIAYKMGYFGKKGRLRPDTSVSAQFRRNDLPTTYRYYEKSDKSKGTLALAGIDPAYTIGSPGWTAWTPDDETTGRLMRRFVMQNAYTPAGFTIVTPDRKSVGIFYSSLPDAAVHFKSGHTITFSLDIPQHIRQDQ